jgi:predicted metal-dependent hydrolase
MSGVSLPPFAISRSTRARRVRLRITREGDVVVTLPARAQERLAVELVRERVAWIEHHRARLAAVRDRLAARPPVGAGRTLELRGQRHDVVVELTAGPRTSVALDPVHERITIKLEPGDERSIAAILERWLRAEARREITGAVERHAAPLGVSPTRVTIRDQSSRWGSASRRGTLSFSWRLVLAPPEVLEYVVIHELAHLRELSHAARFWRLVGAHTPHVESARRWLRDHEPELRHALD